MREGRPEGRLTCCQVEMGRPASHLAIFPLRMHGNSWCVRSWPLPLDWMGFTAAATGRGCCCVAVRNHVDGHTSPGQHSYYLLR